MANYSNSSLYGATGFTGESLDVLNYRQIPPIGDDVIYEIKPQYNYRPDLLASDLYDDAELWWVFKSRNPGVLEDPIFDFVAGINIFIPNIDTIRTVIGNR